MAKTNYYDQYLSQIESIQAQTAHEQHILEFRAMCAKMIDEAIPAIKE